MQHKTQTRPPERCHLSAGFTLLELLVVVSLLGLLSTLAAPSILFALEKARGRRCGANLLLLEAAKEAYYLEHPTEALRFVEQLLPYLRQGMPACPSGGLYSNLYERLASCSCSLNGKDGDGPVDGAHDCGF